MKNVLMHPKKKMAFILLSLADLTLTWLLITRTDGAVYEANPVARWCLDGMGWLGLAAYKAATAAFFLAVVAALSWRSPMAAGRLMWLACGIVLAVVVYSGGLWCYTGAATDSNTDEDPVGVTVSDCPWVVAYREIARTTAEELAAGRYSLLEAVGRLEATDRAKDEGWRRSVMVSMRLPFRECLAIILASHVWADHSHSPELAEDILLRVSEEFEAAFGHRPDGHLVLPTRPKG